MNIIHPRFDFSRNSVTRSAFFEFRRPQDHPGRELCTVYYAPVNHMDVLFADGSWLPFFDADTANQGACLGREFAGRNAKGRRVFGLVSGSALATHVLADSSTLWDVPDKWTLEQASTVSVAYVLVSCSSRTITIHYKQFSMCRLIDSTTDVKDIIFILFQAYYGLFVRGKIQANESVFLNSGTNYTVLAALNILQNSNVTVYVSVENESQRQYLHKNYPKVRRRGFGSPVSVRVRYNGNTVSGPQREHRER